MSAVDEKRMTFSEHLEELRTCVIRALVGIILVAIVALSFQTPLFDFFLEPYETARVSIRERTAPVKRDLLLLATINNARHIERHQEYFDKLERRRVEVLSALVASGATVPDDLRKPVVVPKLLPLVDDTDPEKEGWGAPTTDQLVAMVPDLGHDIGALKSVKVTETFMAHIKVALLAASLVAAPWVLLQLWNFIAAGLHAQEKRVVVKVFPFSLLLFGCGMVFGFLVLVPVGLDFLLSYGSPDLIEPSITVGSYLGLLFVLLFVMGLVFQIPLVMTVVGSLGIVDPVIFRKKRKYFLMSAVVAAALLTPPDYVTQLLVAVPMTILFELGILLSLVAYKRRGDRSENSAS